MAEVTPETVTTVENGEVPPSGDLMANVMSGLLTRAGALLKRGDLALALGIVLILVVLILPMPKWMLDVSLAFSITFSVLILMTALFTTKPLEFSTFPTVLLLATMIRLSLNLASTRLILSKGHEGTDAAGAVIEAFGGFVMGGNFVIGIIVFAILVIVNFVVITKGSGRIAEVSARFTLDAMPGKQMAIDADLSSGLIDEDQARARRRELEDESTFFGAMDGAAKFVRGDAIAGLLITFINVIGGMIIGVAQQDISFSEAANSYVSLTVGDGLVTQIPALIVSTAAGLVVTKAGVAGDTDKALFKQLGGDPKAMGLVSFLSLGLAVLPGIPAVPFLLIASVTGGIAFYVDRQKERLIEEAEEKVVAEELEAMPVAEEPISATLKIDYLRLELGYGLLSLINTPRDGQRLTDQIKALRRQIASDMGFVMPSVRIQDNMQLPANAYVVRVKEIESGRGDLRPTQMLVMDPRGEDITLAGEKTEEPTFGLPAMWIDEAHREEALFRGYTVVDPATVITTHLTEVIKDNMSELLSFAETQKLMDDLDKEHQALITDLVPSQITIGSIQRVLQNLLAERVSIRDLPTILEAVSESCSQTRNIILITEHVRGRLSRQISDMHENDQGFIPLVTLSPQWEQVFAESLVGQGEERQLSLAPSALQEFINALRTTFERQAMMGETPVLLTSPAIRPYVRSIVERFRPMTIVMSQNEVHPKAEIETSLGKFLVETKLSLKTEQPLVLQIGQSPGKGTVLLNVLEIAGKPILSGPQAAQAGAPQQNTALSVQASIPAPSPAQTSLVNLLAGSTLNATTLTPISLQRVVPFSPGAPQGTQIANPATPPFTQQAAPGSDPGAAIQPAKTTDQPGAITSGISPNNLLRIFPIGSQFSLTIENIMPKPSGTAGFAPAPVSNPHPTPSTPFAVDVSVMGRITAHTLTGQPIVRTHFGYIALGTTQSIPIGTDITFKIDTLPEAMDSAKPLSPALQRIGMLSSGVWSSLNEGLSTIQSADPALAQQLQSAILPKADIKLAATTLFFLSALRGGDIRGWIGDNAAKLLERLRPDVMRRLGNDFRVFSDVDDGGEVRRTAEWRGTLVPFINGQELEQIRLFTRYLGDEESDGSDKTRGIRFLVDITLTNIGRFQLDGIAETGEKRLDMIIRTASTLPNRVRTDLIKLFTEANDMVGMRGGMIFQASPDSFVEPLAETPHRDSGLGIIV